MSIDQGVCVLLLGSSLSRISSEIYTPLGKNRFIFGKGNRGKHLNIKYLRVRFLSPDLIEPQIEKIKKDLSRRGGTYEGKRVLVTGGAGFLGSWICDVLVSQNAEVVCVDNFTSGHKRNVTHLMKKPNFRLVEHDITQPARFKEKIDFVMHLASRASPLEFTRFPIQILKANTLGIWVALGIAKEHKAKFLFTSTSEVYGSPIEGNIPTPESYNGNVNPTGLRGCYDEAKRCGEAFVMAYHRQHGLDTRIVRIFNTYGPRLRAGDTYGRVISRFVDQSLKNEPITIFGDGKQSRSFLYVTDQVYGLLMASTLADLSGQIINIGSQEEMRIIRLAVLIKKMTDSNSTVVHLPSMEDDPERRCPDIRKATKLLAWRPQVKLKNGLHHTIDWFKENRGRRES